MACVPAQPDALKAGSTWWKRRAGDRDHQPVLLNSDRNGNLWVTAFCRPPQARSRLPRAKLSAQVKDLASRWSSETGRPLDEKRLLTAVQAREGKPVLRHPVSSLPRRTTRSARYHPNPDTAPAETAPAEQRRPPRPSSRRSPPRQLMAELPPVRAMRKPAQACCLSAMAAEVSRMLRPAAG